MARDRERLLQLEPGQAGHPHVEHEAGGGLLRGARQELAGRAEHLDVVPGGRDQPGKALRTDGSSSTMSTRGGARASWPVADGSVNENVAPPSGLLMATSSPPWASTMERAMANPMPRPSGLVV